MTTIEHPLADTDSATEDTPTDASSPRRGPVFWIVRYLPAELAGTAAMVFGGLLATVWTDTSALIALAALVGEILGFYLVLAVTIYSEQTLVSATPRRAVGRTIEPLALHTHDWRSDPFALGAYSYARVGEEAEVLAEPIERTIYFAGEALPGPAQRGTVHAAMHSGERAAQRLIEAL